MRPLRQVLFCLLALCLPSLARAGDATDLARHLLYSTYSFGKEGRVIDLGTQPLAVPIGVVSETMRRDLILKKALEERGWEFRSHNFLKGPDQNFFFQRRDLDLAMAGDFPSITVAAKDDIVVVGLVKQGFSSLLAKDVHRAEQLKGKRVGIARGTTSHYCLLVALERVGLKESDVTPVQLEVSAMVEALEKGAVDAFACWEPTTNIALRRHPELNVVQQVLNTSLIYLSRRFVRDNPEIADLLVASYARALRWLRSRDANLMRAVEWQIQAAEQLLGKPSNLVPDEVARITTSDLLKIARHPVVPEQELGEHGNIRRAFAFLKQQGLIPAEVAWERVAASFDRGIMDRVLANPQQYQLLEFDYAQ